MCGPHERYIDLAEITRSLSLSQRVKLKNLNPVDSLLVFSHMSNVVRQLVEKLNQPTEH